MKRASIFFYILLIFLQVQCGTTYLLYDYLQKDTNDTSNLSPLLLLLGESTLLIVEPISWVNFSAASISFPSGGSGSFAINTDYPFASCPGAQLQLTVTSTGVPINLGGTTDIYEDGCPANVNYTYNYEVTGNSAGTGQIIIRVAPYYYPPSNFPDIKVNQVVGVVGVTVSP
ncbi:hypothetical protein EHO58_10075 [Leptospira selangorensis]|uniref:hypothetical protein n=1 Tax=Leptospira selangorensis TaxID=2484982 RepID=UPI001083218F|nr:hypothetical protein [Leptospira selangorensis]TGK06092.1 hypothetical protein EHO58_10075 [Leptospira selangorensis]